MYLLDASVFIGAARGHYHAGNGLRISYAEPLSVYRELALRFA